MSTRSTISVVLSDGTVRTAYCHFDGYLMGVGRTLLMFWNSQELAEQITAIGNMSILGQRIDPIEFHSFTYPESGTCVLFGRDRGEPDNEPRIWISLSEYNIENQFEEYNYLFYDNAWHVSYNDNGLKGMQEIKFNIYGTKVMVN